MDAGADTAMSAYFRIAVVLLAAIAQTRAQWRRKLANELFFYSGIDGSVEEGWSDGQSFFIQATYNHDTIGAEGAAKIHFRSQSAVWRLDAGSGAEYSAKSTDMIRLRIRSEEESNKDMELFVLDPQGKELLSYPLDLVDKFRLERIRLGRRNQIKTVGIRNKSFKESTIYVAYMYLEVN